METIEQDWRIRVRNESEQSLYAVKLKMPKADSIEVADSAGRKRTSEGGELVDIGDLGPIETTEVVAWYESSAAFGELSLTHRDGVGRVAVWERTSPFWVWLSKNWLFVLFELVPIGFVVYSLVQSLRALWKRERDRSPARG